VRIAAIDLGSNSFHLIVVDARFDGTFSPLARAKEMLRLGDVVAKHGEIGPEAMADAIEVLTHFKTIVDARHCDEVIAFGTAAIREASDGEEFIELARRATGFEIQIVNGLVEAQTIFAAIRASVLIDPAPALAADLGGGSLELMVGDQGHLQFAASARLGVGRLTAELLTFDPPSSAELKRVRARIAEELGPTFAEIHELRPQMLIGSSGTFACLARMAVALRDGLIPDSLNQLAVHRDDVDAVAAQILTLSTAERARLPGCDPRRAELLPAGVAVLSSIMEETGLDELVMSEWALREGMIISAIGGSNGVEVNGDDPRAIRRASVLSLCLRSSWRQGHARQVAALALDLFDQTRELHGLSVLDKELLDYAALSHDIGEHISRTDHDRHTAYLLENGGLRGFSPDEIRMLSLLGRFHYRGTPRLSHSAFALLDDDGRHRVLALAAILRVADALDAAHSGGVQELKVTHSGGRWTILSSTRTNGELESWAFERKKDLFEKVFGVELELVTGHLESADLGVDPIGLAPLA
jgi:exopolyphosphatase / guanosine-5'-triphosphate,3'-diphosphate pyrophosphatase